MSEINMDFESSDFPKLGGLPKWKKMLIIGSVIAAFVILLIIIIILIATSGTKNEEEKKIIGQIICNYEISNRGEATKILGDNFKYDKNLQMNIGKNKIKFSKEYKFGENDDGKIVFDIYSPINMDYMFKDVSALTSVFMHSNYDAKVTSMVNTFENCENLNDFTISGFITSKVKSMKNLFYNSKLSIINIVD